MMFRSFQKGRSGFVLASFLFLQGFFSITAWAGVGPNVGDVAPLFALPDTNNQQVALKDFRGRPLVLVFYRGEW
jgi:hypothetical protein